MLYPLSYEGLVGLKIAAFSQMLHIITADLTSRSLLHRNGSLNQVLDQKLFESRMMKPQTLPFFVYGTLLPDQPNFFLWGSDIIAVEPAKFVGGQLYDMGYYPMLVTAVSIQTVQGMAITVDPAAYKAVVQRLDELEGYDPEQPEQTGYQRRQVEVILENGRSQQAWVYLGQSQLVQNKPRVASGNWATYTANNQPILQEWWETISTVAGLHNKK